MWYAGSIKPVSACVLIIPKSGPWLTLRIDIHVLTFKKACNGRDHIVVVFSVCYYTTTLTAGFSLFQCSTNIFAI